MKGPDAIRVPSGLSLNTVSLLLRMFQNDIRGDHLGRLRVVALDDPFAPVTVVVKECLIVPCFIRCGLAFSAFLVGSYQRS